jgi:uncharacterized tellurite resistance protein B-like protein
MPQPLGVSVISRIAESDRVPFIKVLAHLAAADDEVTLNEKQAVMDFAEAWDLNESAIGEARDILRRGSAQSLRDLVARFSEPNTPFLLLQELVRLSHADGEYGSAEREQVVAIAEQIGLSRETVEEVEEWIERGLAWDVSGTDDVPGSDDLEDLLDSRSEEDHEHDLSDIETADREDLEGLIGDEDDDASA